VLEEISINSGTKIVPNAAVKIKSKGKSYSSSSSGDGPVDACYKAIDKITKTKGELVDYSIQSVTKGKDALGEVNVKVRLKDKEFSGRGTSTDILEASAKAYVNAINKFLSQAPTRKTLTL
jgi:2-isopropylmalate synthase (EC 2.3.3.13)